ncbi:hypothetical protein DPMN_096489 [Dreissena polymorpha]|uniref:Ionotropic glutamate receptor C-terminal domain-containing protein n=1 Tax=Dreissena polymorpha TaxID=45954 RepID=A0A9D4R3P9_DREPO|nr:hypothetical protein DPMN_096489 [Dreissena polymorpha]
MLIFISYIFSDAVGYVRTPRSMGARVLVLAWWFFVLIILFFYVANLVNFLRASASTSGHSKIRGFKSVTVIRCYTVSYLCLYSFVVG